MVLCINIKTCAPLLFLSINQLWNAIVFIFWKLLRFKLDKHETKLEMSSQKGLKDVLNTHISQIIKRMHTIDWNQGWPRGTQTHPLEPLTMVTPGLKSKEKLVNNQIFLFIVVNKTIKESINCFKLSFVVWIRRQVWKYYILIMMKELFDYNEFLWKIFGFMSVFCSKLQHLLMAFPSKVKTICF